jgi:hypothetical protein
MEAINHVGLLVNGPPAYAVCPLGSFPKKEWPASHLSWLRSFIPKTIIYVQRTTCNAVVKDNRLVHRKSGMSL